MHDIEYDVVVIGAGTAGLAAYREVVSKGLTALLIEKSNRVTTTCAQFGCMPSKLLIASAKSAKSVFSAAKFGVEVVGATVNSKSVFERIRSERDRFVGFVERGASQLNKIHGEVEFVGPNLIIVNNTRIKAEKFIIATGTSVRMLDAFKNFPEILTNESIFEIDELPSTLLVVGAGVIGLELGVAFSQLGVQVTLINNGSDLLGLAPEIQKNVQYSLKSRLTYLDNTVVTNVQKEADNTYAVELNGITKKFDKILMAAGRIPNLTGLGLEKVWPELNFIKEMDPLTHHVKNTSIYLAGDVDAARPLLHEAAFYGKMVGEYVSTGKRSRSEDMTKMVIIFSDPQIMIVGDNFNERIHFSGTVDFSDQGRSRVDGVNEGILEVYFDKESKLLKGAQMSGPSAEHIAHLLTWSIEMGATLDKLLKMPFYHPVVEEGLRTALRDAASKI